MSRNSLRPVFSWFTPLTCLLCRRNQVLTARLKNYPTAPQMSRLMTRQQSPIAFQMRVRRTCQRNNTAAFPCRASRRRLNISSADFDSAAAENGNGHISLRLLYPRAFEWLNAFEIC